MADLIEQGYRLVYRAGSITWAHQLELEPGDVDVTEMDDDAFELFVRERFH